MSLKDHLGYIDDWELKDSKDCHPSSVIEVIRTSILKAFLCEEINRCEDEIRQLRKTDDIRNAAKIIKLKGEKKGYEKLLKDLRGGKE